ncbi:Bug family tripartite tricarboxylate transporter substrate binding protein [Verticiella alkaliphila]|uniref:Bug family tripartite tricarboxylate transporter substrate binding protein n=1 Tax=Verticiella alkaliphila TaxID=2779529 RepID=UPI00209B3A88|nr:tripartite tricarboxylate transporter substrate binding protein [Verticiella sp. GG226]
MTLLTRAVGACALLSLPLAPVLAADADPYPTRAIKWIVPYLAGTGPDLTARVLSDAMSNELGQPIVVENRGGVGGNLGAQLAARAAPDGYTWLYSGSPMAASMRLYAQPGFDVMKDFVHVGGISRSDSVVLVNRASPYQTLSDLVAGLSAKPGELFYASGGVGTPSHLGAESLLAVTQTTSSHVPYKGASESTNAVASDQVSFALSLIGPALPHIQGGRLKPLAVLSPERNRMLPEVPTTAEAGVADAVVMAYGGLSVPAGTPPAVVSRIAAALDAALQRDDVRGKLENSGLTVTPASSEAYTQLLRDEMLATQQLADKVNLPRQ